MWQKEKLLVLSNFFFCHYVFKKLSAAEVSESIYMRERVNAHRQYVPGLKLYGLVSYFSCSFIGMVKIQGEQPIFIQTVKYISHEFCRRVYTSIAFESSSKKVLLFNGVENKATNIEMLLPQCFQKSFKVKRYIKRFSTKAWWSPN